MNSPFSFLTQKTQLLFNYGRKLIANFAHRIYDCKKRQNPKLKIMKQFSLWVLFALCAAPVFGQSTNENFPTPATANEISGTIPARDIGDSRLTRHFYTFFGDNGDLDLTIETANFDGDIDVFEAATLRPLVKITIYAASQPTKTSRIVYFRQRQRVILRVEGRTLSDEPASYQINLSGTFAAANLSDSPDIEPTVENKTSANAVARVNSAGAIIEVLPPEKTIEKPQEITEPKTETNSTAAVKPRKPPTKPKINVQTTAKRPAKTPTRRTPAAKKTETAKIETANAPDPLASINLIILLKNGDKIERPMSEVFRVSVDKGQLTVINKNGKIERFNLLEVQKMSIE